MSLLDAFASKKRNYTRQIPTVTSQAGMQIATFSPQSLPIAGVLMPVSRSVRALEAGVLEEHTHTLYTADVLNVGDRIDDADGKKYLVQSIIPLDDFTEVALLALT